MAAKLEVYKCEMCGNIVEVLHGGAGALVCCGEEMVQIKENTTDAAQEKHVPVKEDADHGVKVTVGSVAHPMEPDHFIEWIEVIAGGQAYREFLEPGGEPAATFCVDGDIDVVRSYCNKHGLWKA